MTSAREALDLSVATLIVVLVTPLLVLMAAPARVVRCVYRDGRDLWRMLAP